MDRNRPGKPDGLFDRLVDDGQDPFSVPSCVSAEEIIGELDGLLDSDAPRAAAAIGSGEKIS
jgi:hypothetical protein